MSSRKKCQKQFERDREKGLTDLREAAVRAQTRTRLPAILIIEALTMRYEKSTNPLGIGGNLTPRDLTALLKSGKLDESGAEYVDMWLTEEELFDAVMADHIRDHGCYNALSLFNETMKGLKSAQLIHEGLFKKTWHLWTTSPLYSFLEMFGDGVQFTNKRLAKHAGKRLDWATRKLAATTKLGITKQVGANTYELA